MKLNRKLRTAATYNTGLLSTILVNSNVWAVKFSSESANLSGFIRYLERKHSKVSINSKTLNIILVALLIIRLKLLVI
jgi:DNA-binding sugar fermentation-stimulating protein